MATKAEVEAVLPLVEANWDEVADLVEAVIDALDEVRAEKITYAAVMQMSTEDPWYLGLGYYPGEKSARAAVEKHPAAGMAKAIAVVPVRSPRGLKLLLDQTDRKAELGGDFELIAEDVKLYKLGWDGKNATRQKFVRLLKSAA